MSAIRYFLSLFSDVTIGEFEALKQQVNRIDKTQHMDKRTNSSEGTHTVQGSVKHFFPGYKN